MSADVMGLPLEMIRSRVVFYEPVIVDLKRCQAIHGCDACPYIEQLTCSSIHFGICIPIKQRSDIRKIVLDSTHDQNFSFVYRVNEKAAEDQNTSRSCPGSRNLPSQITQPSKTRLTEPKKELVFEVQDSKHVDGSESTTKSGAEPLNSQKNSPAELTVFESESPTQHIKAFYFPMGVPKSAVEAKNVEVAKLAQEEFDKVESKKMSIKNIGPLMKVCNLPYYWKAPFFKYLSTEESSELITFQKFLAGWRSLTKSCFDDAAMFVHICSKPDHNYLEFDDFLPIVQDVVDYHPGLTFLQDAPEFHSRYIQTVISRIFYTLNRSWSGKITVQELRSSNLLKTIERLEIEEDINQVLDYFSYEHFYVIYCKFWELDQDHDLLISESDLARHNNYAISSRMINRIFSGAVTRNLVNGKLTYKDFVWFLISEEDKKHPRSIEYWFRCMDLDGDGIISMYEMEYFYQEQVKKMELLDIETLPFQDCLCQMLDMINPVELGRIRLRDLKASSLTPIFFDTFFNLEKYLRHEQKDPFSALRDGEDAGLSDFEKFAAEEYEMLVAEEGTGDSQHTEIIYDDDFEGDDGDKKSADDPNKRD